MTGLAEPFSLATLPPQAADAAVGLNNSDVAAEYVSKLKVREVGAMPSPLSPNSQLHAVSSHSSLPQAEAIQPPSDPKQRPPNL